MMIHDVNDASCRLLTYQGDDSQFGNNSYPPRMMTHIYSHVLCMCVCVVFYLESGTNDSSRQAECWPI